MKPGLEAGRCSEARGRVLANRNRTLTLGIVSILLSIAHIGWPDAAAREPVEYFFVITLGYGHLLGAAIFSRNKIASLAGPGVPPKLLWVFLATSVTTLFAAYSAAGEGLRSGFPLLVSPLLAIAIWHTVENDLALREAYGQGLRVPKVSRLLDHNCITLGISAVLLALAVLVLQGNQARGLALSPWSSGTAPWLGLARGALGGGAAVAGALLCVRTRRRASRHAGAILAVTGIALALLKAEASWLPQIGFGDFFAATTLYHLVQWLVFFADRGLGCVEGVVPRDARALWRRIGWIHAIPLVVCSALLLLPAGSPLVVAVFSPSIYLFWSSLHVAQTAVVRESRRQRGLGRAEQDATA